MSYEIVKKLLIPEELKRLWIAPSVLKMFGYDPAGLLPGAPMTQLELLGICTDGYWKVSAFVRKRPGLARDVQVGEIHCRHITRYQVLTIADSWIHGSKPTEDARPKRTQPGPNLPLSVTKYMIVGVTLVHG